MIAFGPDTDVPPTRLQQIARRVLIGGCMVLGLGVASSAARLAAMAPAPIEALRPLKPSPGDELTFMAADRTPAVPVPVKPSRPTPVATAAKGERTVLMWVTAYCPCAQCCGKQAAGITASGKPTSYNYGHFVAAPAEFAFGSKVTIPKYNKGRPVPVCDRGGLIKGDHLDVFFPTHQKAQAWGRQRLAVTIAGD